jgi:cytochrome P450
MDAAIPHLSDRYPLQQALAYRRSPIAFVGRHWEELGDCFSLSFAGRRIILVNDPDYVQRVFQGNHRNYIKAASYRKLRLLLGNGLFTSEGDAWLRQRRLIQPSFGQQALGHFVDIMAREALLLVERWRYLGRDRRPFSLLEEMSETTLSIVCEALLGQRLEGGAKVVNRELPKALDFMVRRALFPLNAPLWVPFPSHLAFRKSVARMGELIGALIEQRERDPSPDLLGQLLRMRDEQTGEPMPRQQLLDEVMTFFLAGHETTAVALSWAFFLLGQHEDIARQARNEGTRLMASGFSPALLAEAKVLQAVSLEALRLYPPAWTLAREALGPDRLGPYPIAPGDSVVVNAYWLHRHPHHWTHPERFDPSRFAGEAERHRFAYLPFGAGPRLCIGQHFALFEMQVVLATVLAHFQVEILSAEQPYSCTLTLRPRTGMPAVAYPI